MILGFTGTQRGLTPRQLRTLRAWLTDLVPTELHHGDCVGADRQCHELVRELFPFPRCVIVGHPPLDDRRRAFCDCDRWVTPKAFLIRDREVVDACEHLLAAPAQRDEIVRSGTWATWRYAGRVGRFRTVIEP